MLCNDCCINVFVTLWPLVVVELGALLLCSCSLPTRLSEYELLGWVLVLVFFDFVGCLPIFCERLSGVRETGWARGQPFFF